MTGAWRKVKPGWYVLAFLLLYSVIVTVALTRSNRLLYAARDVPSEEPVVEVVPEPVALAPEGLWFPVPGASLPQDASYLPNAPRIYRNGVNQGFDFYGEDAGIPIAYGSPVVAAAEGTLTRVDAGYSELSPADWQMLLDKVSTSSADEDDLNRLRGRQIWLRTDDGRVLRYGHLSAIRAGLTEGERVYRGQVIGYVGNSGTDDGVAGTTRGSRLHFEIWQDGTFFGQDLDEASLRAAARNLFVGP